MIPICTCFSLFDQHPHQKVNSSAKMQKLNMMLSSLLVSLVVFVILDDLLYATDQAGA